MRRQSIEAPAPMRSHPPSEISAGARERALSSEGHSSAPVFAMVERALRDATAGRIGTLIDLGCGHGHAGRALSGMVGRYIGGDVVLYSGFHVDQHDAEFVEVDLNGARYPFADASADVVLSVETIEHVENPRAMVREMARIVRPGGWVVITTPNQLSLTSKLYLVFRDEFHAFQRTPGFYPAHITALVPEDLRRIAAEAALTDIEIRYTDNGRIPFTGNRWPRRLRGQWFSDNVLVMARRPKG